jgi:phosphoribosyl-AMP cyclohydrolase
MSWVKELKYDKNGLITAVVQDYKNKDVLMVAYMNKEALKETIVSGKAHFYSRSRKKLWLKGESSGHIQKVKSIYVDCDMDCLLLRVEQTGGACHTGYRSCFYRKCEKGSMKKVGKKVFDPNKIYKNE